MRFADVLGIRAAGSMVVRWPAVLLWCLLSQAAWAGSGSWNVDLSDNWSAAGNWTNNVVASGGASTAFFTNAITADRSVVNDEVSSVDLLSLTFGSPSKNWTVTGGTFNFTNGLPTVVVNANTATVTSTFTGNKGLLKCGPAKFVMSGTDTLYGNLTVSTGEYVIAGSRITDTTTTVTNRVLVGGTNAVSPALLTITGSVTNYIGDITVGGSVGFVGTLVLSNAVYYGLNDNASLTVGCLATNNYGALWSYNSTFASSNDLSVGNALDSYGFMYLDGGVFDAQNAVGNAPRMGLGGNGGTALIYANNLSSFKISTKLGNMRLMNGNGVDYSRVVLYFNNCTNVYSPQAPDATTVMNLGAAKIIMDNNTFLNWSGTWNVGSKDDSTGFSECVIYNLNGAVSSNTLPAKVGGLGRIGMVFNGGTWIQTQVSGGNNISTSLYNYGWMIYSNGCTYNYGTSPTPQRFFRDVLRSPAGYGISGIAISSPGAKYIGAPYVQISGGSGTGAVVLAHVDRVLGTVTNFQVVCPGYGYLPTDMPTVTLIKGGYGSGFTPAVAGTVSFATNGLRGSYLHKGTGNATYLFETNTLFYGYFRSVDAAGPVWLCSTDCLHNATLDFNGADAGSFIVSNNFIRPSIGGLSGSRNFALANNNAQALILELGNNEFTNTYSGVLSGAGGLVKVGGGVQTLSGNQTFTGITIISNGVLQLGAGGTSGAVVTNIDDEAQLVFNRSDVYTYGGVISGTGSVVVTGGGTLIVKNTNTFSGSLLLTNGVLSVTGIGKIFNCTGLTIASNAQLTIESTSDVISNSSSIRLCSGGGLYGKLYLTNGVNEKVGLLYFDSVSKFAGVWGATGSGCRYTNNNFFAGSGTLTVLSDDYVGSGTMFSFY